MVVRTGPFEETPASALEAATRNHRATVRNGDVQTAIDNSEPIVGKLLGAAMTRGKIKNVSYRATGYANHTGKIADSLFRRINLEYAALFGKHVFEPTIKLLNCCGRSRAQQSDIGRHWNPLSAVKA